MRQTLSAVALSLSMAAGAQAAAAPAMFSQEQINAAVDSSIAQKGLDYFDTGNKPKKQGRTLDAKFVTVAATTYLASGFDIETTDRAFGVCREYVAMANPGWQCVERGNLPKFGLEHGGKGGHYAVNMGLVTGVLGVSYLMKRSKEPVFNKVLWWALPLGLSAIYVRSGILNVNSYNNYHQLIRDYK